MMVGSLFSYLRKLAANRSQAFTCCAGCEALPVPIGNRLCVSVTPIWEADAVLPCDWSAAELLSAVEVLRAAMPWLRRIHVPAGLVEASGLTRTYFENVGAALPMAHEPSGRSVSSLPEGIEEADLHHVEALAEHFLVFPPGRLPATPLLPVDFFTPNGLPLLFAAPGGSAEAPNFLPGGPIGRTKSLSALFASACAAEPTLAARCGAAGYTLTFALWAYAERHGILSPSPFAG